MCAVTVRGLRLASLAMLTNVPPSSWRLSHSRRSAGGILASLGNSGLLALDIGSGTLEHTDYTANADKESVHIADLTTNCVDTRLL